MRRLRLKRHLMSGWDRAASFVRGEARPDRDPFFPDEWVTDCVVLTLQTDRFGCGSIEWRAESDRRFRCPILLPGRGVSDTNRLLRITSISFGGVSVFRPPVDVPFWIGGVDELDPAPEHGHLLDGHLFDGRMSRDVLRAGYALSMRFSGGSPDAEYTLFMESSHRKRLGHYRVHDQPLIPPMAFVDTVKARAQALTGWL